MQPCKTHDDPQAMSLRIMKPVISIHSRFHPVCATRFDTTSSTENNTYRKFGHFKHSLRVKKRNICGEYSSYFKPSKWNYLHFDWINVYRSKRTVRPRIHLFLPLMSITQLQNLRLLVRLRKIATAFLSSLYLTLSSTPLGQLAPVPKVSVLERVDCIIIIISQYKTLECWPHVHE